MRTIGKEHFGANKKDSPIVEEHAAPKIDD